MVGIATRGWPNNTTPGTAVDTVSAETTNQGAGNLAVRGDPARPAPGRRRTEPAQYRWYLRPIAPGQGMTRPFVVMCLSTVSSMTPPTLLRLIRGDKAARRTRAV